MRGCVDDGRAASEERSGDVKVQRLAQRDRNVLVQGLPYQVMTEHQVAPVLGDYLLGDGLVNRERQLSRQAIDEIGDVAHPEPASEHGAELEELACRVGERCELGGNCVLERGRDALLHDDGATVVDRESAVAARRAEELAKVERVTVRTVEKREQRRVRLGVEQVAHQCLDRVSVERRQRQPARSPQRELFDGAFERHRGGVRASGEEPHHRVRSELEGEYTDCQERGRVRPLQVVERDEQRRLACAFFDARTEPVEQRQPLIGVTVHAVEQALWHEWTGAPAHRGQEGGQGRELVELVGRARCHYQAGSAGDVGGLAQQSRLANPCLALEDEHRALAQHSVFHRTREHPELVLPSA